LALGRWVSAEGLVFPEYESAVVEAFAIKQDWDIYAVVDFGYSNAFAVSFWAEHYADETYYLIDEYYIREKTVAEHCAVLRGFTSPWRQGIVKPAVWVSDHDAEDRATMHREGIVTIPAKKDIISGIDAVRKMFLAKKGWKIRIFNTCTNALSELSSYHYPEKKTGTDADEKPVKGNDHLCDTIRYFAAWKSTGTTIKNFGRLRIR
jgi:phage terminase large subunit